MMPIEIRPVGHGEFFPWYAVYSDYGEVNETPLDDEKAVLVWSWIIDDANGLECLVAVDGDDVVGLAHFREFVRPLQGSRGLYVDDLFVTDGRRGQGIEQTLIAKVGEIGRSRHADVVRWTAAKDDDAARALYDSVAEKTKWVTYDQAL
jgi:GNAT superfamily N-acetyltransferase